MNFISENERDAAALKRWDEKFERQRILHEERQAELGRLPIEERQARVEENYRKLVEIRHKRIAAVRSARNCR